MYRTYFEVREVSNGGMLETGDRQPNSTPKKMMINDRLWVWLAEEPSDFENCISDQVRNLIADNEDNAVVYTSIYSFDGNQDEVFPIVHSAFPREADFPFNHSLSFFHIQNEMTVRIPSQYHYSFYNDGKLGLAVNIYSRELRFNNQTLMVFASSQSDFDSKETSFGRNFDAIGYAFLMLGRKILNEELIGSYFCTKRKKFICSKIQVVHDEVIDRSTLGFRNIYQVDKFDARDNIIHAAIWFVGRAFRTREHASKIVFYRTAIELLCGKSALNVVRKIYKKDPRIRSYAEQRFSELDRSRNNLLHSGVPTILSGTLERCIHAVIIDAIMYRMNVTSDNTAFATLLGTLERAPHRAIETDPPPGSAT